MADRRPGGECGVGFCSRGAARQGEVTGTSQLSRGGGQFENTYFTEMNSGSEAGSYLRLVDFVCRSTLGLRVIKKKKRRWWRCAFASNCVMQRSEFATRVHRPWWSSSV